MSIWTSKPSTPAPAPRPGVPTPSKLVLPWSSKPASKPAEKPAVKPSFLDPGKFRTHDQLINEIKKSSYYKSVPTLGKKFSQNERVSLIKELEKLGKGVGGLTGDKMKWAIKKMEKAKEMAPYHREFGKVKALDQKIKQAKAWQKAWSNNFPKK